MNKYPKAFLQALFSTSKFMLCLYGWVVLSVLALENNVMAGNVIFYSGLVYGTLWIFEKQFAKSESKEVNE